MEKPIILSLLLLLNFFTLSLSLSLSHHRHHNHPTALSSTIKSSPSSSSSKPNSHITVMGTVYCDICSNNSFSAHSYFLAGVDVNIDCKFRATAPKTAEEITFSVNRTTNRFGWYKLEIPSVDGIQCAEDSAVVSLCRASLIGSSFSSSSAKCNVPGYKSTSDVVYFKSSETNVCIYGLSALSFRPPRRNKALCGN